MVVVVVVLLFIATAFLPLAQRSHSIVVWAVVLGSVGLAVALVVADVFLFRWYYKRSKKSHGKRGSNSKQETLD